MKYPFIYIFAVVLLFSGCKSTSKLIEQGDYDKVIERSIKKALKGKADADDVILLDKAYKLANLRNLERIDYLKSDNRPENWEEIYNNYVALNWRQSEVRKVLPLKAKGQVYDYQQIDYSTQMIEAKTKAAEYFYSNGKRLMDIDNVESYRQAYHNFIKAKKYGGASTYPDIETQISDARYYGTSRVLIEVMNTSRAQLPIEFTEDILALNTNDFKKNWIEYHVGRTDRNAQYDYFITLYIQNISVSPESTDRTEFERKTTVQDGFSYALDDDGNVKKDTAGNDIKIPKYVDLRCLVVESHQLKDVIVKGQVEFLVASPKRVMKVEDVSSTSVFKHSYARARGDKEALSPEELKLLDTEPLPFPDDLSMIMNCIPGLKEAFHNSIKQNKRLLK